jgi:hypothetical protein
LMVSFGVFVARTSGAIWAQTQDARTRMKEQSRARMRILFIDR